MIHDTARKRSLDLLRSIAIAWVFLFHYSNAFTTPWIHEISRLGWAGVDLFFVLSGFLIASQVLKAPPAELGSGRFLRNFYLRRALRTLPSYWFVLALYFLVPAFAERDGLPPLWKFLTFTQNLSLDHETQGAFSHAWSLCVEECFYLIFPVAVLIMRPVSTLMRVTALLFSVFAFGIASRAVGWITQISPALMTGTHQPFYSFYNRVIYYPTYNRLDGLLVGISIALIYRLRPKLWERLGRFGNALSIVGFATLAGGFHLSNDRYGFAHTLWTYPLISFGFGCLVLAANLNGSVISRLRLPGMTWIATLAFSIYLTHKQVIQWSSRLGQPFSVSILASLTVGALLYFAVERPFQRLRDRYTNSLAT